MAQEVTDVANRRLVVERVYRTGLQGLYREGDKWYVRLQNRTNDTWVEIPEVMAPNWREKIDV